jgi:hypothetical protein
MPQTNRWYGISTWAGRRNGIWSLSTRHSRHSHLTRHCNGLPSAAGEFQRYAVRDQRCREAYQRTGHLEVQQPVVAQVRACSPPRRRSRRGKSYSPSSQRSQVALFRAWLRLAIAALRNRHIITRRHMGSRRAGSYSRISVAKSVGFHSSSLPNKAAGSDRPPAGACGYPRRWHSRDVGR